MHILVLNLFLLTFFYFFYSYLDEITLNARPEKDDIAVIMYTSGSTGTPKRFYFESLIE